MSAQKSSARGEIIEYECADCGGIEMNVFIGHSGDGNNTYLIISCGNKDCVEFKRQEVGAGDEAIIVLDELDITGQGYDPDDLELHRHPSLLN